MAVQRTFTSLGIWIVICTGVGINLNKDKMGRQGEKEKADVSEGLDVEENQIDETSSKDEEEIYLTFSEHQEFH